MRMKCSRSVSRGSGEATTRYIYESGKDLVGYNYIFSWSGRAGCAHRRKGEFESEWHAIVITICASSSANGFTTK